MEFKRCLNCKIIFYKKDDECISVWKKRKYCSLKCFNNRERSQETCIRISESTKGRISWNKGLIGSQIAWNKGIPRTEEEKMNISIGYKRNYKIENHPNFGKKRSEETKNKQSNSMIGKPSPRKGVKLSEETKKKCRISKLGKKMGKNNHRFGIPPPSSASGGKSSYYISPFQGEVKLRSTYELAYSKYMDSQNTKWYYEWFTFDLGNTTYTPDFFLPETNEYVEIKGYMSTEALNKINKFKEMYPEKKFKILYKEDLKDLERRLGE